MSLFFSLLKINTFYEFIKIINYIGIAQESQSNIPIVNLPFNQISQVVVSDGAGRAIIVYEQYITAVEKQIDIRAVRINQLCVHVTG